MKGRAVLKQILLHDNFSICKMQKFLDEVTKVPWKPLGFQASESIGERNSVPSLFTKLPIEAIAQPSTLHGFPHTLKNVTSSEKLGRSETTVAVRSLARSLYCMAIVRRAENHCCQALLVLWSGSASAKSTYLAKGGTNSCLDFSLLINIGSSLFSFRMS